MEALARLVIASTDLVEAEGRLLRQYAVKMLTFAGVGTLMLIVFVAGLVFLTWGLFQMLASQIGTTAGATVFGIIFIAAAAGVTYRLWLRVR